MTEIDIYVRGAPQNLREAPQVYDPYAVCRSDIFIGDDLKTLLANPEFVRARDAAFEGWTPDVMDIRVTADGSVLVRGTPREEWRNTHFRTDDREVQQIAAKTQEAWQRLQRSRESSRESSPRPVRSPSPLREREVVYEREAPRELTERLHQLERENQDLRSRLDRMELQGQLGALGRQLEGALERLDGANETIRGLADQVRALQAEIQEIQRRQDQTNQTLQGAIVVGLALFAALAQQGQLSREQAATIDRLRADNERLQGTNGTLTRDLEAARAATNDADRARDDLAVQLARVQEELRQLKPENEGNRAAREQAEGELARIKQALQQHDPRAGETAEAAIKRFIETIDGQLARLGEQAEELGRLREKAQAYDAAQRQQQDALAALSKTLGVEMTSIEQLPGAVATALSEAKRREKNLEGRLESKESELADATREVERLKAAARKVATEHTEAVEALEGKVRAAEQRTAAAREETRGLHQQLSEKSEALAAEERKTANQARELAALREQVSSLEARAEEASEREAALQERVRGLEATAAEKEQEVRTQQRTLNRLQGELAAAQEENGSLTEALEAAREALRTATREHEASKQEQASRIETLTRQVGELERKVARAEATEGEQTKALEAAEGARRAAEKQSRELTAQLDELRGEKDVLERKVVRKDQTIERLKGELTKAREERSDAVMRQSEMRTAHHGEAERLNGKVSELTAALRKAEEERDGSTDRNGELQRELSRVSHELQEAKDKLEASEQALERLTKKLERSDEEKNRLSELLGTIESYERTCAFLRKAPRSLAEELAAADFKGAKYTLLPEDIKSLIGDLKGQIKALKANEQAVRLKEGQIAELQSDLAREKEKDERATKKIAYLEAELLEQEQEFERLKETHRGKRSQQSATLSSLRSKLALAKDEAATALSRKDAELRELTTKNKSLTRTTAQQQGTIRKLEEELAALKASYGALDDDHERLKARFSDLEAQHKALLRAHEELGKDRDYYQEGAALYEGKHKEKQTEALELERELSKLRPALEALQEKERALTDEKQRLYTLFGEGVHTADDAEDALDAMKRKQVRALEQKDRDIAEQQEEVERLLGRVQKTEEQRRAMKEQRDAARERESQTAAELSRTQGRNRALERELTTVKEGRARLQQQVESANEQNALLLKEGERQREAMEALAAKNQATVDQLLEQHSAQLVIAQQEAERAKAELTAEQQKHASAKEAGEVMAEMMEGMDQKSLGLSLNEIFDGKDLQYVNAYIECAKQDNLGRYQGIVDTQVRKYNNNPFQLSDLSLFTDFFEVTTHLSQMKTSREFVRLQSINKVLKTYNTEGNRETIARLTKEKQTIIQGLLRTFFSHVRSITTEGNKPLSRFQNIGIALWQWNDTLHGLDGSFYSRASNPGKGFRPSIEHKNTTVNLEKLEEMRQTVAQLHTSFRKMLAPFIA